MGGPAKSPAHWGYARGEVRVLCAAGRATSTYPETSATALLFHCTSTIGPLFLICNQKVAPPVSGLARPGLSLNQRLGIHRLFQKPPPLRRSRLRIALVDFNPPSHDAASRRIRARLQGRLVSPEEFRRYGHELIDWLADYHESLADRPVMAKTRPGEIRDALPSAPPERAGRFSRGYRGPQSPRRSGPFALAASALLRLFPRQRAATPESSAILSAPASA